MMLVPTLLGVAAVASPLQALRSVVLVALASALAALLSRVHPAVVLPTVVLELVLGILIGPQVLSLATENEVIVVFAKFGLALLFFFAGVEVIEQRVPHREIVRGTAGWVLSIALGFVVGAIAWELGLHARPWLLAVALSTTTLGTLVPIISDSGIVATPLGTAVLGTGVAGEFWPIILISVFLTSVYGAALEVVLLFAFLLLVTLTVITALRVRQPTIVRVLRETLHTTGQAAVRLAIVVLAALVYLAARAGFDFVLGAFAAGLVVGLVLDSPEGRSVRMRLEGIAFGLMVPFYFVETGLTFDLDSLLSPTGIGLAALFLVLLLIVRGSSALLWRRRLTAREVSALAFFGATGLPLIVAIVGIATDRGAVTKAVGASLIAAGMVSVLVFPLVAGVFARRGRGAASRR
jgi:Kef-type K+ transport system membrane component KefB